MNLLESVFINHLVERIVKELSEATAKDVDKVVKNQIKSLGISPEYSGTLKAYAKRLARKEPKISFKDLEKALSTSKMVQALKKTPTKKKDSSPKSPAASTTKLSDKPKDVPSPEPTKSTGSKKPQPLTKMQKLSQIAKSPKSWWKTQQWNKQQQQQKKQQPVSTVTPPPPSLGPSMPQQSTSTPSLSTLAKQAMGSVKPDQPEKPHIPGMPELPDVPDTQVPEPWIYEPPEVDATPSSLSIQEPEDDDSEEMDMSDLGTVRGPSASTAEPEEKPKKKRPSASAATPASRKSKKKDKPMPSMKSLASKESEPEKEKTKKQPKNKKNPKPPPVDIPAFYSAGMKSKDAFKKWQIGDTVSLGKAGHAKVTNKIGNRFYLQKPDGTKYVHVPFQGLYKLEK